MMETINTNTYVIAVSIPLQFEGNPSSIAGGPFGEAVFDKQIKNKIKGIELSPQVHIELIFPRHVERVAISFTQGLTKELAKKYAREDLMNWISVKASSQYLADKIKRDIDF